MDFIRRLCFAVFPVLLRLLADFIDDYFGGDLDEG